MSPTVGYRSGYERVSDEGIPNLVEEGGVSPQAPCLSAPPATNRLHQASGGAFRIRVLEGNHREHTVIATASDSVLQVKTRLSSVLPLPVDQIRLIFAGKLLQDDQSLEACGIQPNNTIHLFARPAPQATQPAVGGPNAGTSLTGGAPSGGLPSFTGSLFGDPDLVRSVHSVKLFSSCLVAICLMQLLLLCLKMLSSFSDDRPSNSPGDGGSPQNRGNIEDTGAMLFMQILMNALGLYVGLIGVRSANLLDLRTAKAYFYGLIVVGTLWLSLRVVWAINSVNIGYDAEIEPPPVPHTPDNGHGNGTNSEGGAGGTQGSMSRSELVYMVTLSVLIYAGVWSVCFLRASQFYHTLRRQEGAMSR